MFTSLMTCVLENTYVNGEREPECLFARVSGPTEWFTASTVLDQ